MLMILLNLNTSITIISESQGGACTVHLEFKNQKKIVGSKPSQGPTAPTQCCFKGGRPRKHYIQLFCSITYP